MEEHFRKVKSGALVLKGEKKKKKKKHRKREREEEGDMHEEEEQEEGTKRVKKMTGAEDCAKHGGWWVTDNYSQLSGPVALQFSNSSYIKALDNGKFVLGAPPEPGQGPQPEEILMAMKVGEGKISLKSGYDKYIRLDKSGHLSGTSDAVGALEMFEPVWEDGKMALLGPNSRFLSADEEDFLVCDKDRVGPMEMVRIRSNREREDMNKKVVPEELRGRIDQVETKMVKKFQKWQDHKLRLNPAAHGELLVAKKEGRLHETLLDRREKMKSDRMCK